MGILTLGLLGVAAVFPVGSFYMQKAEISDSGSAIAQSVMNDIVARGMLNPGAWYVMMPTTTRPALRRTSHFGRRWQVFANRQRPVRGYVYAAICASTCEALESADGWHGSDACWQAIWQRLCDRSDGCRGDG